MGLLYKKVLPVAEQKKEEYVNAVFTNYNEAHELATRLPPHHPTRLQIVLDLGLEHNETLGDRATMVDMFQDAIEQAEESMQGSSDEEIKNAKDILNLMREYLDME